MKKLVALLMAVLMLLASVAALAEAPEGYPEVVPGIDFGGQTIYIYDCKTGVVEKGVELSKGFCFDIIRAMDAE